MSRIGKQPVTLPAGVTVSVSGNIITVEGKKGKLSMPFDSNFVSFSIEDGVCSFSRVAESKDCRARQGLYRSLLQNNVVGVSEGFTKTLEIKGVGYRAKLNNPSELELSLGYSHPVIYALPKGIEVEFAPKSLVVFTVKGNDKQQVGQVASEIRAFRKPEPYKGKGIRYQGEYILRKAGKSAK